MKLISQNHKDSTITSTYVLVQNQDNILVIDKVVISFLKKFRVRQIDLIKIFDTPVMFWYDTHGCINTFSSAKADIKINTKNLENLIFGILFRLSSA